MSACRAQTGQEGSATPPVLHAAATDPLLIPCAHGVAGKRRKGQFFIPWGLSPRSPILVHSLACWGIGRVWLLMFLSLGCCSQLAQGNPTISWGHKPSCTVVVQRDARAVLVTFEILMSIQYTYGIVHRSRAQNQNCSGQPENIP